MVIDRGTGDTVWQKLTISIAPIALFSAISLGIWMATWTSRTDVILKQREDKDIYFDKRIDHIDDGGTRALALQAQRTQQLEERVNSLDKRNGILDTAIANLAAKMTIIEERQRTVIQTLDRNSIKIDQIIEGLRIHDPQIPPRKMN